MHEQAKKIAELLKVLANENRLMILCALMDGDMTVGELCAKVTGISQPALSQHLLLMRASGILDSEKKGQNVTYTIADHRVDEIINVLKNYYCKETENE